MTTYRRKSLLLALAAATGATALTAGVPASAAPKDPTAPAVRLSWRPCAQPGGPATQECADLPVPLDYADPYGRQITVAVSRVRSDRPEARRGTLAVVPGGPGSSGVDRLTRKGVALGSRLDGAYDLVALDPRGVGGSAKASCGLSDEDRMLTSLRPWPGPDGDVTENVARSRRTAEACARDGGAELRSFTTANQIRDLDRFREALGERKLSAWGVSYGSYVAAGYAQKFPGRTDRWILDSTGDPDPRKVARGWLGNMGPGVEARFPDFAAWAAHPDRGALRLAERPEEVEPLILSLAAELDGAPRKSNVAGVPLTGNGLRQSLQNTLVSDASFPAFAELVTALRDPKVEPVLPPELARPLSQEDAALMVAVVCNDVAWPRTSTAAYGRAVAEDRERHPLTAGMTANAMPCAFWKTAPTDKPVSITDDGPSNILMIQNRRDPATPLFGALEMREALGDRAVLVTVERGGHGAYLGNGNPCGDATVTRFLTTGERPAADTTCAG
ncbi:alpha/beta hydrolase [Streptomyces sp. NPDC087917]|uniref:alpha/beta hydrolase n=1 Tax=Streptomyces sp. NPDC087917 TaxID=3155060 RepID=UPI003431D06C